MRAVILLSVLLGVAACRAQPPTGEPEHRVPDVKELPTIKPIGTDGAAAETVALPGNYRVAGVDGADIDQPYAITATITPGRIHVTADCLNFAWDYTVRRGGIATKRVAVEGCGRGLTASEEAVVAAFDAAATVVRTPANAIELRGGEHSVTLFSQ